MPSWLGEGRGDCPEELSPNGATSTSPSVGRQERRDLPAESGEGMKVRTLFAGAPVLPPSPPPLSHLPLHSYTLDYLVCPAMSIDDTSSQLPARLPRFCLSAAHVDNRYLVLA